MRHWLTTRQLKNELDEAGALMSRAEAQRSDGDLAGCGEESALAQPLVDRAEQFLYTGRFYYGRAGLYRAQGRLKEAIRAI